MRALLLVSAVIAVLVASGCLVLPGTYYSGGGGYYYPSTYSITLTNGNSYSIGWALTPPGQWYSIRSGYLYPRCSATISGLSGPYDIDIYNGGLDGPYAGSYRINGGGSYICDTPAEKDKNYTRTVDVNSDTVSIILGT